MTAGVEKIPCKNFLFCNKFEESLKKVWDRSEKKMALVVKGLTLSLFLLSIGILYIADLPASYPCLLPTHEFGIQVFGTTNTVNISDNASNAIRFSGIQLMYSRIISGCESGCWLGWTKWWENAYTCSETVYMSGLYHTWCLGRIICTSTWR